MASRYWIKLYHEILDDPKMGRMPDNQWRATIELFLLAGELDKDGLLPPMEDICWRLRWAEEDFNYFMKHLQQAGVVAKEKDNYVLVNFARRQAPATGAERAQRWRDRQIKEQYGGTSNEPRNETLQTRYADTDTDTDTELKDKAQAPKPPKTKIDKSNLLINATPGGATLKREMDKARASKGQAPIKYYANIRQAEAFEVVFDELGDELQPLIRKGLQRERESRSALLAFLEVCARNKRNAGQPARKTSKPKTSAEDILAQLEKE